MPSANDIVDQFAAVAMGHEHGAREAMIRKWADHPPSIALFTNPQFDLEPYVEQIANQVAEVSRLTGLGLSLQRPTPDTNLRFGFFPRRDFLKISGKSADEESDRFLRGSACLGISKLAGEQQGTIVSGAILIGTDIDEDLRRHCMLEELVQMMGLPNDACHYRPSLFCEDDMVTELTPADAVLIQTLYDPRLAPGMRRSDALPVAREIIEGFREEAALAAYESSDETAAPNETGRADPPSLRFVLETPIPALLETAMRR